MEQAFVTPSINGYDKAIGEYLHSLLLSIKNVDISFIRFDGTDNKKDIEHVERVFAYELYHQWCNNSIISKNKNLMVNAEIPKVLIDENREKKIPIMYPDLLLHHGQNVFKGNLIICEIKRERYVHQDPVRLLDDLLKLRMYISPELKVKDRDDWKPYEVGVFVMTIRKDVQPICSLSLVREYLKKAESIKTTKNIPNDDLNRQIVCVVYNGNELKYDTLHNIINEI